MLWNHPPRTLKEGRFVKYESVGGEWLRGKLTYYEKNNKIALKFQAVNDQIGNIFNNPFTHLVFRA